MLKPVGAILLASGVLLAAGCAPKKAPPRPQAAPSVNDSMTHVFSVQAQTIWDITSGAFNAKGDGLLASKVSADDWAKLGDAGRKLEDRAQLLAKAKHVLAVAPGEVIMGADSSHPGVKGTWDAASPQQVQFLIDSNPGLFAERARNLARVGEDLVKASQTRDIQTLYKVSAGLDEDCDSCHQPFWGTDEPPPVKHTVRARAAPRRQP